MANKKRRMHVVDDDEDDDREARVGKKKKKKKKTKADKKDLIVPMLIAAGVGAVASYALSQAMNKRDDERRLNDSRERERDLERVAVLVKSTQQAALPEAALGTGHAPTTLFAFMEDD